VQANGYHLTGPVAHRHPLDPDPVRSTKAMAVLALGIVALPLALVVAGAVPAALALLLARDTAAEMRASEGFLTGGRYLLLGVRLARVALLVVVAVVLLGIVLALFGSGGGSGGAGPSFGPDVN
jgi:hydroxylaminobenzene mutase